MDGLLSDVRVLDLTLQLPGPYATQLMADLGADVLRVEPPGGDPARVYPSLFAAVNRGKRSIVLDLKDEQHRLRARQLAGEADVVMEGFRPGVAGRLGIDEATVRRDNPAVVYCSISGYGQAGAMAQEPGHDLNYQAVSGMLRPDGKGEPLVPPVPIADMAAGLYAAFAVCAALRRCALTGEGEYIDVSMADLMLTWTLARLAPLRDGQPDFLARMPHYGVFPTADGAHVALGVVHERHFWESLCDVLGLPDHIRASSYEDRMAEPAPVREAIAARVAGMQADGLVARMRAADVPVTRVHSAEEAFHLDHFRARGTVAETPWGFTLGHPARLMRHPAALREPAPAVGAHDGEGFRPRPDRCAGAPTVLGAWASNGQAR